jgi:membrane-associated phospholipid phosphatase
MIRRIAAVALSLTARSPGPALAAAPEGLPVPQRPLPARVPPGEASAVAAIVAADVVLVLLLKPPQAPRWNPASSVDDQIRAAFRADSAAARSHAAALSDVGLFSLAAFPLLIDAGLVTWGMKGDRQLALNLALTATEALAIDVAATALLQKATGRPRPLAAACDPRFHPGRCAAPAPANDSFPSGHTSAAFTAASLLCVQHARLDIFGKADPLVCPFAVAAAAATGALRIVADRHWATDVLAGAALGTAVGTAVGFSHFASARGGPAGSDVRLTSSPMQVTFGMRFP